MPHKPASKLAERAYKALQLTNFTILPEYHVGDRLRVDYVVRELHLAIEIDGEQHDQFNAFMHGDKDGFRDSKKRDNQKEMLCEQEGLKLIRLKPREIMNAKDARALLEIMLEKAKEVEEEDEW